MLTFSCRWLGRRGRLERWVVTDVSGHSLLHPETLACWSLSLRPGCVSAGVAVGDMGLWMVVTTPVQPLRVAFCPLCSRLLCWSKSDQRGSCLLLQLKLRIIYKFIVYIPSLASLSTNALSRVAI